MEYQEIIEQMVAKMRLTQLGVGGYGSLDEFRDDLAELSSAAYREGYSGGYHIGEQDSKPAPAPEN